MKHLLRVGWAAVLAMAFLVALGAPFAVAAIAPRPVPAAACPQPEPMLLPASGGFRATTTASIHAP